MSPPIRTEPEASAELEEAAIWYENQRSGLGFEFLRAVDDTIEFIVRWPRAGAPVPGVSEDIRARRVPVKRFPYHVAYLATTESIRILAIAHDRRRPGYWHPRIQN